MEVTRTNRRVLFLVVLTILASGCREQSAATRSSLEGYYSVSAEFPTTPRNIRVRGDIVLRFNADSSLSGRYWFGPEAKEVGLPVEGALSDVALTDRDLTFAIGSKSLAVEARATDVGIWKGEITSEEFGVASKGRISLARGRDLHFGRGLFRLSYTQGHGTREGRYIGVLNIEDVGPRSLELNGELKQYERDTSWRKPFVMLRRVPVNSSMEMDPSGIVAFEMPFENGVTCTTSELATVGALGRCDFGAGPSSRIAFEFLRIPAQVVLLANPIQSDTLFSAMRPSWIGTNLVGTATPVRGYSAIFRSDSLAQLGPKHHARVFDYNDGFIGVDSVQGITEIDQLLIQGSDTFALAGNSIFRIADNSVKAMFISRETNSVWPPVEQRQGFAFTDGKSLYDLSATGVAKDSSPWLARGLEPVFGGIRMLKDRRLWIMLRDSASRVPGAGDGWYSGTRIRPGYWTISKLPKQPSAERFVFLRPDSVGFHWDETVCLVARTDVVDCPRAKRRTVAYRVGPDLEAHVDTLGAAVSERTEVSEGVSFASTYDGRGLVKLSADGKIQDTIFVVKDSSEISADLHVGWVVSDRRGGAFASVDTFVLHFRR